jgi:hypothetical protein
MANFKVLASVVVAATAVSTLAAETGCPGNVAGLPFRLVNRHQIILPVSVNHSGPYNFLLDTGTQITMVDPTLASELRLATQGQAEVASAGMHASASFAQLEQVETGSHAVAKLKALVYDLKNLQATRLDIRGVLGEDFLENFDMLIDNAHSMLCLDNSNAMRGVLKGAHVSLVAPVQTADITRLPSSLIVSARLSDSIRPVRLKLDSGSNVSFLYNTSEYMALGAFRGASLPGGGANSSQHAFTALPPQTLKIGSVEVSHVGFVTMTGARKDSSTSDFDGLLAMGLFKRVFIDHADHFAVLEPF